MNSLSLLLSWRYLVKTKQERSINTMIKICFLGIALGTFSLALVVAIMRGFEQATHEHMQGIHAHIIMQAYGNEQLDFDAIQHVLKNEFPEVVGISPTNQHYGIIQDGSGQLSMLVTLKAIDPIAESQTTSIETKLLNKESLKKSVHTNRVAIGEKLAAKLHTSINNQFQLLFAPATQDWSKTIHLDSANLTVGGVFKTGIEEFDSSLILCTLEQAQELFPDAGITSVQLKLKNKTDESILIKKLKKRFELDCYSWKELYPALLAALKLEKYASFIIIHANHPKKD
jgi:lipoprotein-releasing system permease protein